MDLTEKKTASVSIVAANYNNGQYLHEFIGSICQSTYLPEELIIIDDGSTDDSMSILEKYINLPFLKIIRFEHNQGFCTALNAGIDEASGDFILRIDPDDIILKSRIEKQLRFFEENKDVDVVGSNVIYFLDETKKDVFKSNFPADNSSIRAAFKSGDHGVQHPSTMIRTNVMKKYRYNQINVKAEDYELFAQMIKDGHRFANIQEPLTKMRIHGNSVSINIKYEIVRLTFQLRDRIFGTKSSPLKVRFYYWHIINYKKSLIAKKPHLKLWYLFLSGLFYPSKVVKRIF